MELIILLMMIMPQIAFALEAKVSSKKDESIISFEKVEVPRNQLKVHLKSGLHSRFVFEVIASKKSEVVFKKVRTWKVYYDLWDEVFRVTALEDNRFESTLEFKSLEAFFDALEKPEFKDQRPNNVRKGLEDQNVYFGIRVVLNPISPETVERVKKWVHQRRVPGNSEVTLTQDKNGKQTVEAVPRFQGLFNEILGYQMNSAQNGAAWIYEGVAQAHPSEVKK